MNDDTVDDNAAYALTSVRLSEALARNGNRQGSSYSLTLGYLFVCSGGLGWTS